MLETSRTSPLVSVIVPVFNGEQFLTRCLDSIFAQTMPDFEVLVVNDGSTDETASILAEYAAARPELTVIEQSGWPMGLVGQLCVGSCWHGAAATSFQSGRPQVPLPVLEKDRGSGMPHLNVYNLAADGDSAMSHRKER